ncbi:hypothetical protein J2S09_001379 [Bacillus fengqiuensis]|nr:hypothetical protein [Bacillus fengqiuensis]
MTMDNAKEPHLLRKNKHKDEKRKLYHNMMDISAEYTEAEVVTSVDFVFVEGEGWKLESKQ